MIVKIYIRKGFAACMDGDIFGVLAYKANTEPPQTDIIIGTNIDWVQGHLVTLLDRDAGTIAYVLSEHAIASQILLDPSTEEVLAYANKHGYLLSFQSNFGPERPAFDTLEDVIYYCRTKLKPDPDRMSFLRLLQELMDKSNEVDAIYAERESFYASLED